MNWHSCKQFVWAKVVLNLNTFCQPHLRCNWLVCGVDLRADHRLSRMLIISCSFFFLLAGFLQSYLENTRFEQKALITAVTRLAFWQKPVYNTNNSFKAFFVLSSNWWASSCYIIQCDVMCLVHNIFQCFKCLFFKFVSLALLLIRSAQL